MLVVPNQQAKYDAEKEEKKELKAKQDELQKVEDAKKKEAERGTYNNLYIKITLTILLLVLLVWSLALL